MIDPVWLDPNTAEAEARRSGRDLWKAQLRLTFGKYANQSFKWLLENDVGWVVWLLAEFHLKGEKSDCLKLQKERLLEFANEFEVVRCALD